MSSFAWKSIWFSFSRDCINTEFVKFSSPDIKVTVVGFDLFMDLVSLLSETRDYSYFEVIEAFDSFEEILGDSLISLDCFGVYIYYSYRCDTSSKSFLCSDIFF